MYKLQLKSGNRILDTAIVEHIEAQMQVWAYMCGGVSGMVNWNWQGKSISRPKVKITKVEE